jgi:hypothetical protein
MTLLHPLAWEVQYLEPDITWAVVNSRLHLFPCLIRLLEFVSFRCVPVIPELKEISVWISYLFPGLCLSLLANDEAALFTICFSPSSVNSASPPKYEDHPVNLTSPNFIIRMRRF